LHNSASRGKDTTQQTTDFCPRQLNTDLLASGLVADLLRVNWCNGSWVFLTEQRSSVINQ